ncbi:Uu.00g007440.m01.CDS01 [Anthostomella pinea]|uniref:Uu.00g007440.m01.CDS01 n=1 Tax=Anthostomella pinea TaxID=933095 RepID=A0AAI8VXM4_9PEZI|nr:Uu.00g007440.m01.CDS01 [Anthostomella pinea]
MPSEITTRKSAPMKPARYHYPSDGEEQRPEIATKAARKWRPSQPPRYHYDSDSEDVPTKKRGRPDYDLSNARPAKRISTTPPSPSPASGLDDKDSQDVITDLQAQNAELLDFIRTSSLALKAPPSIRKQLEGSPNGASKLAEAIKRAISDVYSPLEEDFDDPYSGVTNDDISSAMVPFIADIDKLSYLTDTKSTDLAIDCMLFLGKHSFGQLEKEDGNGSRKSDVPADELMYRLVRARREAEPDWDFSAVLSELKKTNELLDQCVGIEGYFVRSIAKMEKWSKASSGSAIDRDQQSVIVLD